MKDVRLRVVVMTTLSLVLTLACDDGQNNGNSDDLLNGDNTNCAPAETFVGTHGQLQVDGADLKNSCGNMVRLKGISSMWLNWEYDGYAESRAAMQWMIENWDISVIRAAMGTEAQNGYLISDSLKKQAKTQVSTIVENAIALGIYVIIDWHTHMASSQQAEAIAFFTEMAEKYGDKPNVIYEPWNEPMNANWQSEVKPYHEALVAAIREVDPDNLIILGTPQWCQLPNIAVDAPVEGTNLMYTVHFYACDHGNDLALNAWAAYAKDIPIFVTEWGATTADGGVSDTRVCTDESDNWFDEYLNEMNTSFVAWKLDGCNDTSCLLQSGAPVDGPWDNYLHGHASYVIERLLGTN